MSEKIHLAGNIQILQRIVSLSDICEDVTVIINKNGLTIMEMNKDHSILTQCFFPSATFKVFSVNGEIWLRFSLSEVIRVMEKNINSTTFELIAIREGYTTFSFDTPRSDIRNIYRVGTILVKDDALGIPDQKYQYTFKISVSRIKEMLLSVCIYNNGNDNTRIDGDCCGISIPANTDLEISINPHQLTISGFTEKGTGLEFTLDCKHLKLKNTVETNLYQSYSFDYWYDIIGLFYWDDEVEISLFEDMPLRFCVYLGDGSYVSSYLAPKSVDEPPLKKQKTDD